MTTRAGQGSAGGRCRWRGQRRPAGGRSAGAAQAYVASILAENPSAAGTLSNASTGAFEFVAG
jgi:hypothetical protein